MQEALFIQRKSNHPSLVVWLLAALSIIGFYNLIFFNRYFPITEGWFSVYGSLILHGKIPYKDFYFFLTPLYPMTIAGFMSVFGASFLALRILGIILILLMTTGIYLLFARFFKHAVAALVSVFCVIYYQSNVAHITYDFIQFMTVYTLFSGYFFIKYFDKQKFFYILLSGAFASLAFLTKQSNGTLIVAFVFLGVVLASTSLGKKAVFRSAAGFITGAAVPVLIILAWLTWNHALSDLYQQMFVGAVHSKGNLHDIFFIWIKHLLIPQYFYQLRDILIVLFLLGYWRLLIGWVNYPIKNHLQKDWKLLLVFLLTAYCVAVPLFNSHIEPKVATYAQQFINYIIVISTFFSFLYFCYELLKLIFLGEKTPAIILPALSLGFLYGGGTSAGITEVSAFFGFGLFLCYIFSLKCFLHIGKWVFLLICLSLVIFLTNKKFNQPYAWWYVTAPSIKQSLHKTNIPTLKGIYLPQETENLLTTVDNIIQKNTQSTDTILTFPNIPVFYLLNNRFENIKAVVHWPDFLPDNLATLEAQKILANPPKVIVFLDMPELVWETHERLFRQGKPSGQRAVLAAIAQLTANTQLYHLETVIPINNDIRLKVWLRQV